MSVDYNKKYDGYRILPYKLSETSTVVRHLFVKEHSVKEKCPEKPSDRTIFVLNVPPFANEESLAGLFSFAGEVISVFIHSKPTPSAPPKNVSPFFNDHPIVVGYKVAYVVYKGFDGAENVMDCNIKEPLILPVPDDSIGLKKWCSEYKKKNLIDPAALQEDVDRYMKAYDEQVEEDKQREKALAEPDEDGWVTVTRRGKKPGFARKESVIKNIMKKEKLKRSKKQLLNFYRFQIRESKMNHLMQLREKFEEDKKKIAMMKQTRKFKPF